MNPFLGKSNDPSENMIHIFGGLTFFFVRPGDYQFTTQFACFTSTEVQILTQDRREPFISANREQTNI
jgi:hypothetical protein